jgi:MSHA biogenesis protein MshK
MRRDTFFLVPWLFAGSAWCQALPDPTRPPAELQAAPVDTKTGKPSAVAPGELRLQSILIGPHERSAIINGVVVSPGDRVGDARVLSISENQVVLKSRTGNSVLRLFPSALKKHSGAR